MAEASQVYRLFEALWMQYDCEMWDVRGPDDEACYPSPVDNLPPPYFHFSCFLLIHITHFISFIS